MSRRRIIWVPAAAVVAVALIAGVVWVWKSRPPVSGDVAWEMPASELRIDEHPSLAGVQVADHDLTAVASDSAGAVIDADGSLRAQVVGAPILLRSDGSGVTLRERSSDSFVVSGFDRSGSQTFSATPLEVAEAVGAATGERFDATFDPEVVLAGFSSRTVVVDVCGSRGEQTRQFTAGLDALTGKLRWHSRPEPGLSCVERQQATPTEASSVVLQQFVPLTGRAVVRDVDTGRLVWQGDNNERRALVVGSRIFVGHDDGTLAAFDPAHPGEHWEARGCAGDILVEPRTWSLDLRDDAGTLTLFCGSVIRAVDPDTGAVRDLPKEARYGEERFLGGGEVAPSYVTEVRDTVDQPVTPVLGKVLVERKGRHVSASDPVTGRRLWSHEVDDGDADAITAVVDGEVVAARSVRYDSSHGGRQWDPMARLVVWDAVTGKQIAVTRERGEWSLRRTTAGDVILQLSRTDEPDHVVLVRRGRV